MASKAEQVQEIMTELGEQISLANDQQVVSAFEKIYNRLEEAKKCFENGEDSTGKKCTSRVIGLHILKTWRMTVQPDFNKFLVKKMPKQYRKITMLFDKLNKFAQEVLSYDYKQYKKAEDEVPKIYQFLVEGEKGFRLASEREEDSTKAKFLIEIADDLRDLGRVIFGGKEESGTLLSYNEIEERVTSLYHKISSYDWDEYVSNPLRNPTFILNETKRKYPEIMDCYLIKKFAVKKEGAKDKEKEAGIRAEPESPRTVPEKVSWKTTKKKEGAISKGPKIVAQKKIAGKGGKVMPKKDLSRYRETMYAHKSSTDAELADRELGDQETAEEIVMSPSRISGEKPGSNPPLAAKYEEVEGAENRSNETPTELDKLDSFKSFGEGKLISFASSVEDKEMKKEPVPAEIQIVPREDESIPPKTSPSPPILEFEKEEKVKEKSDTMDMPTEMPSSEPKESLEKKKGCMPFIIGTVSSLALFSYFLFMMIR